ncbi:MAG: Crp/Fnr family transcriptional regulator [Actinomycetota bacterium]|nr:Crp/Fnr family transcriptional regulator [Actinomycetota bacterium]
MITGVTPEGLHDRQMRGRWISAGSAERNLGLLRRGELAQLRKVGTVRYVDAGTVVAASGSRVTQVQVVSSGELELRARLEGGRTTMAVVRTGGIIADIPLLLDAPMPFDAIASRETELITLSRQRWTELLTGSPDLALRWMSSIARRLDDDRRRLVVVTSKPLIGQVAYLLLDLAETGPDGQPVVELSHTTIAHLLGARRQSVTRVVGELKRRGLVQTRYGHTVIRDSAGLREVMGSEPLP